MRRGRHVARRGSIVSMESGLEDRNNQCFVRPDRPRQSVSMESGLEDRNNTALLRPP